VVAMIFSGCNTVETISKEDLFLKATQYGVSESTAIYYKGSSDKFDYFTNNDGKKQKLYRVTYGLVNLSQRYQLTDDSKSWILLKTVLK
jgi:hypothetical protein